MKTILTLLILATATAFGQSAPSLEAFYSSRGYYEMSAPPDQAKFSPVELMSIGTDLDGFPRYGLELYRRYQALAAQK